MMRSAAVLAAVVAVCCAVLLGGADAKDTGNLEVGTVLYHASTKSDFRSLARPPAFVTSETQDENLPSSPAWFAPLSSPAVTLLAATVQAFKEWTMQDDPPHIHIFKYKTRKAMALQQYENEFKGYRKVERELFTDRQQEAPEIFDKDCKQATARYFCSDLAYVTDQAGYAVKETIVRKELEYVLCHAHDPEYLQFVSKQQCVLRATKSKEKGATQPVIWVWCSFKVNKLSWYKWDLNAAGRGARGLMAQFKKAGLTDRPRSYPKLTSFREMLTKGKKSKGAVQPATGDEDDQKFIKSPIGKAEMALLKQAAEKIKEAEKFLKPEEVPL